MPQYKYVGNQSPVDYTDSIVLERSEDGNPSKSVALGGTVELTEDEAKNLDGAFVLEPVGRSNSTDQPATASRGTDGPNKA